MMSKMVQNFSDDTSPAGGGQLKYIGVHMHEQQKKNKWKEVFFAVECVKQGTHLGV